jgi:hypothetical protein
MSDAPLTAAPTTTTIGEPVASIRSAPIALLLGAVAVLTLLIGLFTPWASVTVGDVAGAADLQAAIDVAIEEEYGSPDPIGITLDDGALVIVFTVAFAALLAFHMKRGQRGRGLPVAALAVAGVLAMVGIGNLGDIADTNSQLQLLLPVSITASIGLWLTVAGGGLAMAGASLAILKAQPKHDADES